MIEVCLSELPIAAWGQDVHLSRYNIFVEVVRKCMVEGPSRDAVWRWPVVGCRLFGGGGGEEG